MKTYARSIFGSLLTIMLYFFPIFQCNLTYSQEILERGRFSGFMFGDYYYNIMRDPNVSRIPFANYKDPKDENGFEFRRIYFTYDYQISETFSTRLRFEIDKFSLTSNSKITPFVKDAYLQWKDIIKGTNLTFGIQPTPTFDISEFVWENRHLEMTIIDQYGLMGSRDFGISLKGKIDQDGIFNYWFLIGNGSGSKPETDKYKTIYFNFFIKPSSNIYTYINYHHKFQKPIQNATYGDTFFNTDEDLISFFFSYRIKELFKIGFEGFYNFARNSFSDTLNKVLMNRNSIGLSFFTIYYFSKKYNLVGRLDVFDPNIKEETHKDKNYFLLLGFNYKPNEKVSISPVILYEKYEKLPKPSITFRLVFFYIFN